MDVIRSASELGAALAALPPVAPGRVRVYRGQTSDYDTITPASFRKRLASQDLWTVYSRHLLDELRERSPGRTLAADEWRTQQLWLAAIAQHYGSGSAYLDVSHSVEAAAWFALHRSETVTQTAVWDAPGPPWMRPLRHDTQWLAYAPSTEPGWLYTFDVEPWDEADPVLPDLALVDLSRAPEPFCTARMLAQGGCLIRTGETDRYDLKRHCIGDPLQIAWPMTGLDGVARTVQQMFPSPEIDPWYRRLLSAPIVPDETPDPEAIRLRRPVPVTLYRGETPAYNAAVAGTQRYVTPPFLHETLRHLQVPAGAPKDEYLEAGVMSMAVPILLEAPLMSIFPAAASTLWNHELLFDGLGDSVQAIDRNGEPAETVSLSNLLFQFSPLEQVFWDDAPQTEASHHLLRGLWLMGGPQVFVFALISQEYPADALSIGPAFRVRLDQATCRAVYSPAQAGYEVWAELTHQSEMAKAIFTALSVLRLLSPGFKIEATPMRYIVEERKDGSSLKNRFEPSIYANPAMLRQAGQGKEAWFTLRNRATGDPFTTATGASSAVVIETASAYADLQASSFRAAVAAVAARAR